MSVPIPESEIKEKVLRFFSRHQIRQYDEGQTIAIPGDSLSGVSYIKKGLILQYSLNAKGEKTILNSFKPGAFYPMSSAINQTPLEYFFEAKEQTTVFLAPIEEACQFIYDNPDVMYNLLSRVYRGTDGLLRSLSLLMGGDAKSRIINELLTFNQRFGTTNGKGDFVLLITEAELGCRTGLSRETISRTLHDLKEKSLVTVKRGKIELHDTVALQALL